MSNNKSLGEAKENKNDEFYTQLSDIENELKHYKNHFKNKIVFCNCDDPYESNFFKYFALNFNKLGLKKLITTCYAGSPIITEQLSLFDVKGVIVSKVTEKNPYKIEITEVNDENDDGAIDLADVEYLLKNKKNTLTLLKGDGDFRSDECIELLKQADIVVTNPPFSLFREYVAQLIENNKRFIILGNPNAVTYKEFFPFLMDNKIWVGAKPWSSELYFAVPKKQEEYLKNNKKEGSAYVIKDGKILGRAPVIWFTNLDIEKRHEKINLFKRYNDEEYPRYDNYDAINVDKVSDIPCDYYGVMGVPITFLDKYNPEQFKILGKTDRQAIYGYRTKIYTKEDSIKFNDLNRGPTLYINGELKAIYQRLFIQRIEKGGNK